MRAQNIRSEKDCIRRNLEESMDGILQSENM